MQVTIKQITDFYDAHPECIGDIEVETRFGYKKIEYASITAYDSDVKKVELESGKVIETSPDHLLFDFDWKKTKDFNVGDSILTIDGYETIKSISTNKDKEDLYDIQVKDVHEFYANGFVSHNSTILDALSFVLFNKAHRAIKRPQLINSINNKKCLVSILFEIGISEYKIIRGIKPNIFEIWKNGILLNQESNSRDYQKLLENNILKLNHKSFHQVVVLGSSNFIPFMKLNTYQRRSVIEDLLDINIFTKMNIVLKEQLAKYKDILLNVEYEIKLCNEKIKSQNRNIDNIKSHDEKSKTKYNDEIKNLGSLVENLEDKNNELKSLYNRMFVGIKTEYDKQVKSLQKLNAFKQKIRINIENVQTEIDFFIRENTCPTCQQEINEDLKNEKLKNFGMKINTLQEGFDKLQGTLISGNEAVETALKNLNEINKIPVKISTNNSIIKSHNTRTSYLLKQISCNIDSKDLTKEKHDLEKLQSNKFELCERRLTVLEKKTYAEAISELLKDTGIKTKIIKQYLPLMNKLINQYLHILDFFVSFTLDESFSETIRSRHRDDFSYASFSEGEKSRIDLSLLFAWRQIAKLKNSASTNLLILDETFDSSLDSEGVENLMTILNTLDDNIRIFIISHKSDILEGKFERTIGFSKIKNFSVMKEIA